MKEKPKRQREKAERQREKKCPEMLSRNHFQRKAD